MQALLSKTLVSNIGYKIASVTVVQTIHLETQMSVADQPKAEPEENGKWKKIEERTFSFTKFPILLD